MTGRIVALDWGEKRIGIAVTDPLNITAQPLTILEQKPQEAFWDKLGQILSDYQVKTMVVGIPFRTDGKEAKSTEVVRSFMTKAREKFPKINFVEIDERFSTQEAKRILHEGNLNSKAQRKHLDKIAASLILEHYLQTLSRKS